MANEIKTVDDLRGAYPALVNEIEEAAANKATSDERQRIHDIEDLYMAVLWPAAVGKPSDSILWRGGAPAYAVNRGLDLDKNGRITKREAARKVREQLVMGLQPGNVWVPAP